jgi:hypothetical protein
MHIFLERKETTTIKRNKAAVVPFIEAGPTG